MIVGVAVVAVLAVVSVKNVSAANNTKSETTDKYNYEDNQLPKPANIKTTKPIGWWNGSDKGDKKQGVNCFDYYKFQSVQVNVNPTATTYKSGEKVKFVGNIVNENNQPIVNGEVFVRVARKNEKHPEDWDNIVDEFFALKNVTLKANESKPVEFSWNIPTGTTAGDYQANYFFVVGKKFNLGGLSFSNEVIIGSSNFTVKSDNTSYVQFDRSQTQVDGQKYLQVGSLPIIEKGKSPVLKQSIENTFNKKENVQVTYELYYWDGLDESNKIDTKNETVVIPANSEKEITYQFPPMNTSVYFLRITATAEGQKSILNVRLASQQERPRLNYPAITEFPIKKGDKVTLFTCFHNTSVVNTTGRVEVTLTDEKGKQVAKIDYKGNIPSAMSADKIEFSAKKPYDKLKLKAEVYDKNGKKVDSYETVYDCKDFGSCIKKKPVANSGLQNTIRNKMQNRSWLMLTVMFFTIIIISVVIVVVLNMRRNRN